ncbi:hypothetical protein C8J56DRAFT_899287 [Mycena floridula]|nr:hypothetical protein C8J56DRAFT_899287 [Mycena floridula]
MPNIFDVPGVTHPPAMMHQNHCSTHHILRRNNPSFLALRDSLKSDDVIFLGSYDLCNDELVSDKQRVQMTAHEVWKAGGYRFRVHKNKVLASGIKCRMWCCQDKGRKQKEHRSTKPNAKPRENVGMMCYPCQSQLNITCQANPHGGKTIHVYLHHAKAHRHYYDVQMPEGALAIIRDRLETATPNELVGQIQTQFPNVTAAQIHTTWSKMSETVWKRDPNQLLSAQTLLREFPEDVDLFEEGVPTEGLRGKVVEIGLDATSQAVGIGKRKRATRGLGKSAVRQVWHQSKNLFIWTKTWQDWNGSGRLESEDQLCWWHMREALKRRLALAKLSTTPYNPTRANQCFPFIDPQFKPPGHPDKKEHEAVSFPKILVPRSLYCTSAPWALSIQIPQLKKKTKMMMIQEKMKRTQSLLRTSLIPGYAASNPKAIHGWGTKILYNFCVSEDLREGLGLPLGKLAPSGTMGSSGLRSANAEIPVLKTTMILESHWRRIKRTFLHHFASPRVDLLVWILVTNWLQHIIGNWTLYFTRLANIESLHHGAKHSNVNGDAVKPLLLSFPSMSNIDQTLTFGPVLARIKPRADS